MHQFYGPKRQKGPINQTTLRRLFVNFAITLFDIEALHFPNISATSHLLYIPALVDGVARNINLEMQLTQIEWRQESIFLKCVRL